METGRFLPRAGLALALAATLCAAQGCAGVIDYVQYRAQDSVEMVDVGFTFSVKPCVGLYWNSLDLLVGGYSNIDGYFVGLGGNQIGITRCYADCIGLIVSRERVGWGDFDKDDDKTLFVRYGGLAGLASLATGGNPDYTPACVHFFPHIGYVGLVWNARWTQILDFVVGFTTIDLARDDGTKFGSWPWQKDQRPQGPGAWRRALLGQSTPAPQPKPVQRRAVPPPQAVPAPHAVRPAETPTPAAPAVLPVVRERAPVPARPTPAPAGPRMYTVQPGDTLYGIALRFYGDGKRYTDIQAANRELIPDARALRPDTVLLIP